MGLQGAGTTLIRQATAQLLAFASIWTLFFLIYRYFPPRRIPLRSALVAATFTGILFEVSKAMKLPRETEEQKVARAAAMDKALKGATAVPLRVAEACVEVMELCTPAAEKGNKNAVSDAGVAVLMAEAGLRSAALNVLINLAWIKDEAFKKEAGAKLEALLEGKPALRDEIYDLVVQKL